MATISQLKDKVRGLEAADAPMPTRMDAIADVQKEIKSVREKEINRVLRDASVEAAGEIHNIAVQRTSYFVSIPPPRKYLTPIPLDRNDR